MNEKEKFGIVIKIPSTNSTGIILDSGGEYYDFGVENNSIICPPRKKQGCQIRVGDMVGFKKNEKKIANKIRKVGYF